MWWASDHAVLSVRCRRISTSRTLSDRIGSSTRPGVSSRPAPDDELLLTSGAALARRRAQGLPLTAGEVGRYITAARSQPGTAGGSAALPGHHPPHTPLRTLGVER
jgi:hypothetical protein